MKLKKHAIEAEKVLNNSYITFQKINKKSIENEELYNLIKSQKFYHIISVPAYILLESTNTVVHFIRNHPNDKRVEHYQLLLSIIEKNIRKIFYGSILAVFKNLMILEHENYDQKIETRLNTYLTNLYCWTGCLKLIEIQYNKIFWFLNDDKDIKPNGIQNSSDEFEKWLKNNNNNTKNPKLVWEYQGLDTFHDLYNEIKLKNFENTYSLNHYYSIKYLEELAKNLDFMRLCFDINDRAYWKIISTNCLRSNKTS